MSKVARVNTIFPELRYTPSELERVAQLMLYLESGLFILCQPPMAR